MFIYGKFCRAGCCAQHSLHLVLCRTLCPGGKCVQPAQNTEHVKQSGTHCVYWACVRTTQYIWCTLPHTVHTCNLSSEHHMSDNKICIVDMADSMSALVSILQDLSWITPLVLFDYTVPYNAHSNAHINTHSNAHYNIQYNAQCDALCNAQPRAQMTWQWLRKRNMVE